MCPICEKPFSGPYGIFKHPFYTTEDQFQHVHECEQFQVRLDAGEICFHGFEVGKCLEGCEHEPPNIDPALKGSIRGDLTGGQGHSTQFK